jgi:uncharacterized membrane protein
MITLTRRHSHFFAAAITGLVGLTAAVPFSIPAAYTIGANLFFVVYSGLVLVEMPRMTPKYLHEHARAADLPVFLIFAVTLMIVAVAVAGLFLLMNARQAPRAPELAVALASLPLGWFTIQAMAAMHYAHLYWVRDDNAAETEKGLRPAGGLQFPGKSPPNGLDFLYFAATVGMTAQTADTAITSSRLRRAVLLHAIVSFFFNAIIVAAAVNLAVTLGNEPGNFGPG